MKRPFLNPARRFNFAALCAERLGGRNILADLDVDVPENENRGFVFHTNEPNRDVFGGSAWLLGNRRFSENDDGAEPDGSEIWHSETMMRVHGGILVQHSDETAMLGAIRVIALNAMLSGREVKFLFVNGRDELLVALSDAIRKAVPGASCVFSGDAPDSCLSNFILNTGNQLIVMPAAKLVEKEDEYRADLFESAKRKGNILLLHAHGADVPARILQNCGLKLAEKPELIPETGRVLVKTVAPGVWVDMEEKRMREAAAEFWSLLEEKGPENRTPDETAARLAELALAAIPDEKGSGNSAFCQRARRFLAAWVPLAFFLSGNDPEAFRALFSPRAVSAMLDNDGLAETAGWRRMGALFAAVSDMRWNSDDPEDQRFLDQFGYMAGYAYRLLRR